MNAPENKRPVTLEDLLRIKRAERPSREFWTKFESELRAKQLAAIIGKRPWWQRLSVATLTRRRVPLGATAALALSAIVVVQYRSQPTQRPGAATSSNFASKDETAANSLSLGATAGTAIVLPGGTASLESGGALTVANISAEQPAGVATTSYASDSTGIVTVSDSSNGASLVAEKYSDITPLSLVARGIANNLAAAKEAHPELANRFFGGGDFEKRNLAANRQAIDPLAQMRSPSELHRERLLASLGSGSPTNAPRNSERLVRRISDQRLTEEAISRFDARGNEFSLKF